MTEFQQTFVIVDGLRTDVVVQPFADRILVLVSQVGKVGSLIQASIPSTTELHGRLSFHRGPFPRPPPAIELTPLFGSAPTGDMQTLYTLYAAQTATLVWLAIGGEPRSVIVGIALGQTGEGELERETFHAVMGALQTVLSSSSK